MVSIRRVPITDTTPAKTPIIHPIEVNFHQTFHDACNLNRIYVPFDDDDPDDPEHIDSYEHSIKPVKIDYNKFRPYFLHVPIEKIRKTFENTTQHAVNVVSGSKIYQTMRSPYPANNVWRRNEPVATDTIFAEVPAVCTNGQMAAQYFVGRKSHFQSIYGMGNTNKFVNTLEDEIGARGAMDLLITDGARVETSARVKDILRALIIRHWESEPK